MKLIPIAAFLMLIAASCVTTGTQADAAQDTSKIYATVGDVKITEDMIKEELELIPPYQRSSFESPEGKRLLLDHIIERELLLQEAEKRGLEKDSFVIAQVELAMKQVETAKDRAMLQSYYEQYVVDQVTVPEDEILEYYEEHKDDIYHQEKQLLVSHILLTDPADTTAVKEALDAGESFESLVEKFSEHEATKEDDGSIGWITLGSPMPYLGRQDEILRKLFEGQSGDVLGPFATPMGYHFFKISDVKEEGSIPLEEVRESIENTLKPAMVNMYFKETIIPSLRDHYGVTVNEDAFLPPEDTPSDSLFQMAQNLMKDNPQRAVTYFELFLKRFPDNERAHQAQFLIGFTCSEYLEDYEAAENAFQAVINNYPESDFADDAQWMIDHLGVPPESIFVEESQQLENTGEETSGE